MIIFISSLLYGLINKNKIKTRMTKGKGEIINFNAEIQAVYKS